VWSPILGKQQQQRPIDCLTIILDRSTSMSSNYRRWHMALFASLDINSVEQQDHPATPFPCSVIWTKCDVPLTDEKEHKQYHDLIEEIKR
jgi:hypothetical protein